MFGLTSLEIFELNRSTCAVMNIQTSRISRFVELPHKWWRAEVVSGVRNAESECPVSRG